MVKSSKMDEFQHKILLEAISIIEINDYVGLLIDRAKIIIKRSGTVTNIEITVNLYFEILGSIDELYKYRCLNRKLIKRADNNTAHLVYEHYFKSRIRSAKAVLKKLSYILPIQQTHQILNSNKTPNSVS